MYFSHWLFYFLIFSIARYSLFAGDTNIAFGKPVTARGPTTGAASLVTDGDAATFTFPTASGASVVGFYYQIDLGQEYPLEQILLYSQINGNANRLSKVRMSVYGDNAGVPGDERWKYTIRPLGENNPQGGVDVLSASRDPAGTFAGRFIRITNDGLTTNCPDVAEIEVFESPRPNVIYFGPDAGNITQGASTELPRQAVLSWKVAGYTSLTIDQGIGPVTGPTGSVTVSPTVQSNYTLTATNGAGTISRTVTIGVDAVEQPPTISEFLASNVGGIEDRASSRHDWIEIANPNPFALNLVGYFLTDNPVNKTKWRFPEFAVPGNGYAVVWASNSNAPQVPLEVPHTNFSLNTTGEYVALVSRDGTTVLSQFPSIYPAPEIYPPQFGDRSYGTVNGVSGYFNTPTPNAANGELYAGVVQNVSFGTPRGFYASPQEVTISTTTQDAEVRYTTNGAVPTATTGTVLAPGATVPVTATRVLRAGAFKAGWVPATVETNTYLFPANQSTVGWSAPSIATNPLYAPQMVDALKQVPSMSLTVGPGNISGASDKIGALEWIDPSGGPGFNIPCGAQLFGGAFTFFAKKSFRLTFKGEYGAGKLKFPLFAGYDRGLKATDEFDQLELRNGSHDMIERGFYMSNIFTDTTVLDMGSFAPHGRFVHLYLNGAYWGLYHLRERWSADMLADYYGGQETDYESVNGNLNVGGWADPGLPYDGTDVGWTRLKFLARSGPDTYAKLKPWLDVPQYIDYMTMFMFGKSEDEYRTTGPVGEGHGYKFVLNDADGYLFLASYAGPSSDRTARVTPGKSSGDGPGSLFSMLFRDGGSDYRALLADRIHRSFVAPGGAMTPAANAARLTELCLAIDKAIIPECARWNYRTPANWASSRDACLNWFNGTGSGFTVPRTTTVLGHYRTAGFYPSTVAPVLTPLPNIVPSDTSVTISTTTPAATIYYTSNRVDPRLSGTPAPNATLIPAGSTGRYRVPTNATDGYTPATVSNLVAAWSFDTNASESIAGYNGTLTNGAFINTPGKFGGGALELDGANDHVLIGNPLGLQILGQITISAWVKPDNAGGLRNIVNKGFDNGNPNGEISLRIVAGAYQCGYLNGEGNVFAVGPASGEGSAIADVGTWHHLAALYDGSFWRLYRDGVEIASEASATGAVAVPNVGWAIGARGTGTERFFDGQIDEVRIYNRGLSPSEIALLVSNTATNGEATWATPAFDDGAWVSAVGGIGFAPPGSALHEAINQDISPAMRAVNASVFLRLPFTLTASERAQTALLTLKIKADDGFVAYLNGTRVASRNAPAPVTGVSNATSETTDATALLGQVVDISADVSRLVDGVNILAIHGLNRLTSDDDALVSATLTSFRGALGFSTSALTYSAETPLLIGQNSIIRARAYIPATRAWSALTEAFYQVGPHACPPSALAISELHFNPHGDGDGEFIELMNVSGGAINLRGVRFTKGVDFAFPSNRDTLLSPGARLVLVDSQFTFQQIQGWAETVGGIYRDNLSNGGEQITIVSADGLTTLLDFTYDGANPWPDAADGGGRSLVLINPRPDIDHNNPANWRPSLTNHGNPNTSDSLTFKDDPDADLDGDGLTALFEFGLGTSDSLWSEPSIHLGAGAAGRDLSLDHAAGADIAIPTATASVNLSTWDVPISFVKRELLTNGMLRSTWRPNTPHDRLFWRILKP